MTNYVRTDARLDNALPRRQPSHRRSVRTGALMIASHAEGTHAPLLTEADQVAGSVGWLSRSLPVVVHLTSGSGDTFAPQYPTRPSSPAWIFDKMFALSTPQSFRPRLKALNIRASGRHDESHARRRINAAGSTDR